MESNRRSRARTPERGQLGPRVVYIAGSSYSGSTLLGFVIGTDPHTVFLGEANQLTRSRDHSRSGTPGYRICTCGEPYEACPLWSPLLARYAGDVNLNPAPGFSLSNLRLMLRLLSPVGLRRRSDETPYISLLSEAYDAHRSIDPHLRHVVDSSKSIRNLDDLAACRGVELLVVHVVRDGVAVANSYRRHGYSPLYGIAAWALVNLFLRLHGARRRLRVLRIDYASLCGSPAEELRRLNEFLGTQIPVEGLAEAVQTEPYHVLGGNKFLRRRIREFPGIESRSDPNELSRFERGVARVMNRVASPFLRRSSGPTLQTPVPE